MGRSSRQFSLDVISGRDRSALGQVARLALALVEPFYSIVMRLRNWCFDCGWFRAHDLGRPTISIGNITAGGTGKTPVVIWLANRLRDAGHRPAVLLRGYGSTTPGISDEQQLLDRSLNGGSKISIPVIANPSRIAGAKMVLIRDPMVDVFLLDDGFQHRKAKRDFDLVLISATEPFGHGHVLPRGLLREPIAGLKRADAFLITRCSQANPSVLQSIHQQLTKANPKAPIFRSDHVHSEIHVPATGQRLSIAAISGQSVFAMAGIGDPLSFSAQLATSGCNVVGQRWFADHHPYTPGNLEETTAAARQAKADWLLTTAKDWVKIAPIVPAAIQPAIGVVELTIAIPEEDQRALLESIMISLETSNSNKKHDRLRD